MMVNRRILRVVLLGLAVCGLLPPAKASADLVLGVGGNKDLTAGADLIGSQTVKAQADKKTYLWADKNGDGTANDPITGGLDLAGYNITRTGDLVGFVLDLNGNAIINGGQLTTARQNDAGVGSVTVRNATNVTVQGVYAYLPRATYWGNGGAISV
ncbi:MAG: hypothetical protein PHU85_11925, partial [Phycisphaerae bacterium]|nr:hypothetical protein [Phycisphaerae bacterium]